MHELDVLKKLLNCDNLGKDWYVRYGLTKTREEALTEFAKHSDSFFNPKSETALTLFILGNIDRWKQIKTLKKLPRDPSNRESSWGKAFFNGVRSTPESIYSASKDCGLWNKLRREILDCEDTYLHEVILLFEFRIMNSAFHSIRDSQGRSRAFKELSFLNVCRNVGQFDAVLIFPRRRSFIFFESKLSSDISIRTTHRETNQIIRNLESAFLLTHHPDSLYKGWDYKYVFLCPRQTEVKLYSDVLGLIKKEISIYQQKITSEYKCSINHRCYGLFEEFELGVSKRIFRIYWDEFGDTLKDSDPGFFQSYFDNLEEEQIKGIKERFGRAGILTD